MLNAGVRHFKSSILHVNDSTSAGHMRVVIFGGSSQLAPSLCSVLGFLNSQVTFPVRTSSKWIDYLKPTTSYKNVMFKHLIDFKDPDIVDNLIENANVVINLIGAHTYLRDYDLIYDANVTMAKRIAEAVAKNPDVIRFIHVSAVGADPLSPSSRLSTKWLGEQEVKKVYPSATIIRPATIFGEYDNYVHKIAMLGQILTYSPVIDDATELRQPIYSHDIGLAMVNALRMPDTVGKTYELGGPHVYSNKEIHEIIYNKIGKPPILRSIPYKTAHRWMQWTPHFQGLHRYLNLNEVIESKINLTVSPDALSINDLYVKPVAFPQNLTVLLQDQKAKYGQTSDEYEHGWYGGHDRHYEP